MLFGGTNRDEDWRAVCHALREGGPAQIGHERTFHPRTSEMSYDPPT